jgi:uncharacterized protein (DUF433 family)
MIVGMDPLLSRITIDPAVCHGKPCVRGLRYPVENLLELLGSGMAIDEILADYEDLEREDLLAVLAFAIKLSRTKRHGIPSASSDLSRLAGECAKLDPAFEKQLAEGDATDW